MLYPTLSAQASVTEALVLEYLDGRLPVAKPTSTHSSPKTSTSPSWPTSRPAPIPTGPMLALPTARASPWRPVVRDAVQDGVTGLGDDGADAFGAFDPVVVRAGQLAYHAVLPFAARRLRHDLWIENFTPPFSTSFLPLFLRTPVLGFAQALQGRELSRRYRFPFFLIERLGLRCYRDVLVLNPADQALVSAANPAAAVHLIPNGIAVPGLDQARLGRGEHVLFLGRIDVWKKGIDYLIEAYRRSRADLPLVIAGAGLPREERRLAALVAGAGPGVRWVGHVSGERKRELLARSAFMVLPSRYETFGLSALEAMAAAKPVLHFDLPTLVWMDGDVAVPAYDTGVLGEQMRALAGDEPLRRELGRKAHAAAQRYGQDETAERYLALARELLR